MQGSSSLPEQQRLGKHGKRSKSGCLTCRKRHYKCDENFPRCARCSRVNLQCTWDDSNPLYRATHHERNRDRVVEVDSYGNEIILRDDEERESLTVSLSTAETDALSFYIRSFHNYSYQICAWTGLIPLPRRSTIPTILQFERRSTRKMTNWASYFLPHLTTVTADDPLSLAMAAFTAYRMRDEPVGVSFYAKALSLLRALLKRHDAASLNNQDFLRIWATTLLLAECEAHLGNQKHQSLHVEGATTLSFYAASRFTLQATPSKQGGDAEEAADEILNPKHTLSESTSTVSNPIPPVPPGSAASSSSDNAKEIPKNERELPAYLQQLTQRLRHSSTICESLDTEWPTFKQPPIESKNLGGLLEKSAECYARVMPLLEEYYGRMALLPPATPEEYMTMMEGFGPGVLAARQSITEYRIMLDSINDSGRATYSSCAEPGFPFSPIIRFVNPQMAQPTVIPHIFIMFLAPFITDAEHYEAIRYISGVYAGFEDVPGLVMDAAFPDVYVAAFWKRGPERLYFHRDNLRRTGDFLYVLHRIWAYLDHVELVQGRLMTKEEILGVSLKEYRDAQAKGLRLQHTRH